MSAEYRKSSDRSPKHTVATGFYIIVDIQLSLVQCAGWEGEGKGREGCVPWAVLKGTGDEDGSRRYRLCAEDKKCQSDVCDPFFFAGYSILAAVTDSKRPVAVVALMVKEREGFSMENEIVMGGTLSFLLSSSSGERERRSAGCRDQRLARTVAQV